MQFCVIAHIGHWWEIFPFVPDSFIHFLTSRVHNYFKQTYITLDL